MVLSRIKDKINYSEDRIIDNDDKGFNASLYKIEIKDLEITIALGDIKYKYIDDGVLYSPIYLIIDKDNKKTVGNQIGVYELNSDNLMDMLDGDGDLDIEKLNDPLLYHFVSYEYLKEQLGNNKIKAEDDDDEGVVVFDEDDEDEEEEEEEEEEKKEKEGDVVTDDEEIERELTGDIEKGIAGNTFNMEEDNDIEGNLETRTADDMAKKRFRRGNKWIQNFMKRDEYDIIDSLWEEIGTKKVGDCLFSVIQDALDSIDKKISVQKMRERLSKDLTQEIYEHYKEFYNMFKNEIDKDITKMGELKNTHNGMRIRASQIKTTNRSEYKKIVENAKKIEMIFKKLDEDKKNAENFLNEFKFMKNINSLDEMKIFVKTCNFWADTWAISTLERIFNIKLIILSSENYGRKDFNNILLCGQINDEREIDKQVFKPKYYILLDHTGGHYKLITWKKKKILTFNDIPFGIRSLIIEKCMEKNAGKFSLIPKFKKFKNKMINYEEPDEEDDKTLYNSKNILQFYSNSADKPYPGLGAGEKLDEKEKFFPLSKIQDWRRILSNFAETPFVLDGRSWKGVEWYYNASKFKNNNPAFYLLFSLDSKSNISLYSDMAKAAGGKTGIYIKTVVKDGKNVKEKFILRVPTIVIDDDFFKGRNKKEMEAAWEAKFTQNKLAKDVLLKTEDAKLQHFVSGKKPEVWFGLMRLRKKLRNK
jgi:predicted NAD-dependent protein-ADP-ribosyltransferase YbiA (DUF1768 family)